MCRITLKRPRDRDDQSTSSSNTSSSTSAPNTPTSSHSHANNHKKIRCIMSELPERMHTKPVDQECSPDTTVKTLVAGAKYHSFDSLASFFLPPTPEEIAAYDHTVLTAVRTQDYTTLSAFHTSGRPLKCSNKFGESLLHLACRKGMVQMTKFLVEDCQVPLQICDDFGRTVLHDACWGVEPNFALVDLLLAKCPDLLYVKDRRGSTPLQYVRRPQWKHWNAYLKSKKVEVLKARELK